MVGEVAAAPGPRALEGQRLGPYELHREVGRGGMASVYLARDVERDRLVALKVLHEHLMGDPLYVEMFLDEAELTSQIRHRNVCAVAGWGVDDGLYYMEQELLAGETLWTLFRKRARERRIRTPEWVAFATSVAVDLLDGLHAAHEAVGGDGRPLEAIHRDVSPHNVVVLYDGSVRIIDFGIAKAAERDKTAVGVLKGKMRYVAPEQIAGADLDRRVDVWAVGVTLWETLTGRFLFQAKGAVPTLRAVRDQAIHPPSLGNPAVPPALDDVVMKALRRDRRSRTATAAEMASELRAVLSALGVATDPATRADWMAWEFASEIADYERLCEAALSREPHAASTHQSGMRVKTQLVSMAEIIPCDDEDTDEITDVEALPPLARAETHILAPPPRWEEATPIRGPSARQASSGPAVSPWLVAGVLLLLWSFTLVAAAVVGILAGL